MNSAKTKILFLIIIAALATAGFFLSRDKKEPAKEAANFEECAAQGNQILAGYLPRCIDKNGRVFTLLPLGNGSTSIPFAKMIFPSGRSVNDFSDEIRLIVQKNESGEFLLPDLKTAPLKRVYIEIGPKDGKRRLRFDTTNQNLGSGPFEAKGEIDESTQTVYASQQVYKKDGSFESFYAGNFILHPTHHHWHFENFIEYELHKINPDGKLGENLASIGKMTFCVYDTEPVAGNFPGQPQAGIYIDCEKGYQGLSSGWADIYEADVPGQELDIEGSPDGRYAVLARIDPLNQIAESDKTNNVTISFVEIKGNNVSILTGL